MEKYLRSFDKTKIFYTYTKGRHPLTLVFLHGVGANWTVWRREMKYFQRLGFPTLALDLRGHGNSGSPFSFKKYKLPYFSRDVFSVLEKEEIDNFSLIGHSLGGAIIINYCMRYKKKFPKAIALVESASVYPFKHNELLNQGPNITRFLRFLSKHKLTKKQHILDFKETDFSIRGIKRQFNLIYHILHLTPLRSLVKTLDNVERFVFKNKWKINKTIKDLQIPILVIAGDKDRTVPMKYSQMIKKLNEKAELKILKGAHHRVIINHPMKVAMVIREFIESMLAAPKTMSRKKFVRMLDKSIKKI